MNLYDWVGRSPELPPEEDAQNMTAVTHLQSSAAYLNPVQKQRRRLIVLLGNYVVWTPVAEMEAESAREFTIFFHDFSQSFN